MQTLFISDLDGTLLNDRSEISDYTAFVINRLTDNGVLFSVATARNIGTAFDKIKKLRLNAPISLMNGVFTYYQNDIHPIDIAYFPRQAAEYLIKESLKIGASPFLYTFDERDCVLRLSYKDLDFPARKQFYELRKNAEYKKFVFDPQFNIPNNRKPVYINFLDERETVLKVYEIVKDIPGIDSVFYLDPVLRAWYIEVFSSKAGKAAGIKRAADIVTADKIVSFGDNNNDISMFSVSDEAYATANALDNVKAAATGVIASCADDGVAKYLQKRFSSLF